MPLFIKAGAIIPVGPKVQYAMQEDDEPLRIFVYPGADGSYALYEDEGENYQYEKGNYSIIPFHWNDKEKKLTIGKREGAFNGMKEKRPIEVVLVQSGKVIGLSNKAIDTTITYTGQPQNIVLTKK